MAQKREKEEKTPLIFSPGFPDPRPDPSISSRPTSAKPVPDPVKAPLPPSDPENQVVNRCAECRRKVRLTGFRCRCGDMFCTDHRYSDRHDCTFDYKAAGRLAIARDNPVVRPAKILKV